MTANETPAVQARGLHVGYAGVDVLRDLEIEFPAGRISVILGPGGSGKSTLLRTLAGEAAFKPEMEARGELYRPIDDPCFLFQTLERGDDTVAELLAAGRCGGRRCRWAARAEEANPCGRADLRTFLESFWAVAPEAARALCRILDTPTRDVDLGLLRLAAVTATISHDAPFLLLDEPTAEMDPTTEGWIVAKLRELGCQRTPDGGRRTPISQRRTPISQRRTLVMITRSLQVARRVADFIVILVDGQILEFGPTEALFERPGSERVRHLLRMGC